jgi:hypothetical protein
MKAKMLILELALLIKNNHFRESFWIANQKSKKKIYMFQDDIVGRITF